MTTRQSIVPATLLACSLMLLASAGAGAQDLEETSVPPNGGEEGEKTPGERESTVVGLGEILEGGQTSPSGTDPHNLFKVQSKKPFPLDMATAVRMAVENNLDIAAAAYDPLISETFEEEVLTSFDPLYFANLSTNESKIPTASSLSGAANLVQTRHHFDTGIRKRIYTGGTYELRFDLDRSKTNSAFSQLNPSYAGSAAIFASQPLLRGAGVERNLAAYRQARNATLIATEAEADTIARIVTLVVLTYWDLDFAVGNLEVKRISLTRANKLLDENRQRFLVGAIIELDVISAEVDVAQREEELVVAEQRLKDTEEILKQLIQPLDPGFLADYDLLPTTEPSRTIPVFDYIELAQKALAQRWSLEQSRLDLASRDIAVQVAEHDKLPLLDINGSYALNSLDRHADSAVDDLDNGDFFTWGAGLSLEAPFGNRSAEVRLRQRQLELRQALLRHRALEDSVILEVRTALRTVVSLRQLLDLSEQARELAGLQLEKEEARYREGLSTAFQVLDFQEDLATAESNELQARVSLQKALANLSFATGSILQDLGIVRVK